MTEEEWWLSVRVALWLLQVADGKSCDEDGCPLWRSVAARVACLARLGLEMPAGVREWVVKATAYLDKEDRRASADDLLFDGREEVYAAFHQAYLVADLELRQRLAAAQDAFRGTDYYAENEAMLEQDEGSVAYTGPHYVAESAAHCDIIRDIFGNPFRPVTFSQSWRTDTAMSLARGMYDSRDFSAMPILAGALQDAGCDNEDVLNHCRAPGEHVRGVQDRVCK